MLILLVTVNIGGENVIVKTCIAPDVGQVGERRILTSLLSRGVEAFATKTYFVVFLCYINANNFMFNTELA